MKKIGILLLKSTTAIILISLFVVILGISPVTILAGGLILFYYITEQFLILFFPSFERKEIVSLSFSIIYYLFYGFYFNKDVFYEYDKYYNISDDITDNLYIIIILPLILYISLTLYMFTWRKYRYRFNPLIRIIHMIMTGVLSLYYFIIPNFKYIKISGFGDWYCQGFFAFYFVLGALFLFLFYKIKSNYYFFVYSPQNYLLYLRSFGNDINKEIRNNIDNVLSCRILQIADPKQSAFISADGLDNLYLPIKQWKNQVRYYIKHANIILCEIGTSKGVKWEMNENEDYINKYIFNLYDVQSYSTSKSGGLAEESCYWIKEKGIQGNVFFIIKDCYCYYSSNITEILTFYKANKANNQIEKIRLSRSQESKINSNFSWGSLTIDILRFLQRIYYGILKMIKDFYYLIKNYA